MKLTVYTMCDQQRILQVFIILLRPGVRYVILKMQRGKPQAATRNIVSNYIFIVVNYCE